MYQSFGTGGWVTVRATGLLIKTPVSIPAIPKGFVARPMEDPD